MSTKNFDVVVIGAGPGGYIAAIRAAQLGLNVACIDAWKTPRAARRPAAPAPTSAASPARRCCSSEHYEHAAQHFADHGISLKDLSMDVGKMLARKDTVVKQNNDGILYLFKKNKVSFFHGRGPLARRWKGATKSRWVPTRWWAGTGRRGHRLQRARAARHAV
jgi:dihydrolipoamide dehydrogenase